MQTACAKAWHEGSNLSPVLTHDVRCRHVRIHEARYLDENGGVSERKPDIYKDIGMKFYPNGSSMADIKKAYP